MSIRTPVKDATIDAVIARLQEAQAAMLDPLDTPRTWTQREVQVYEQRRQRLWQHVHGLQNATLSNTVLLQALHAELLAAKASLEQQVKDAPDPDSIADRRARNTEEQRQQWLADGLVALQQGVKTWPNGKPMIPAPLAVLLRKTCPTCQHQTLEWPGTIPEVEAEIATMEKRMAEERTTLERLLIGARSLLEERVSA